MTAAGAPAPPAQATAVFGRRLDLARRFAHLLATDAGQRGLLGPREVPRLWERHLLNCAVVTDLLPPGARVVDIGSGAGLPGVVFAIRRPDLRVDLVEPMQRRATFLREVLQSLGLVDSVRVVGARAEDPTTVSTVGHTEWATARAVAPLDRLVGWCLPLLRPGGRLLALKGASATAEVAQHQAVVSRLGGLDMEIVQCGGGVLTEPTAVVVVRRRAENNRPAQKGRT